MIEFKAILETAENKSLDLDVPEPPCKNCHFFRPQAIFKRYGNSVGQTFDGIKMCWADDMEHDFSCWKPKNHE